MGHHMHAAFKPRAWRQVAIGILREFIPPQFLPRSGGDNAADEAAGHGTLQAREGYGLNEGDLPTLTTDSMWEHRTVCSEWWNMCGVGELEIPLVSLRLIRCGRLPTTAVPAVVAGLPLDQASLLVIKSFILEGFKDFKESLVKEVIPQIVSTTVDATLAHLQPQNMARILSPHHIKMAVTKDILPGVLDKAARGSSFSPIASGPLNDSHWSNDDADNAFEYDLSPSDINGPPILQDLIQLNSPPENVHQLWLTPPSRSSPDFSLGSCPPAPKYSRREKAKKRARMGICMALDDPSATEKSPGQLEAIIAVMDGSEDLVVILPTGGGKSLLWHVVPKLEPNSASVIVAPFVLLLDQQLQNSKDKGINAFHYTAKCAIPPGFQHLFLQPESAGSAAFKM